MFGERQNNLDFTVFITLKETEDVTILNTESLQTAGKIYLYFDSCKKEIVLNTVYSSFIVGPSSRSSSLNFPIRNSDQKTIEKAPPLIFLSFKLDFHLVWLLYEGQIEGRQHSKIIIVKNIPIKTKYLIEANHRKYKSSLRIHFDRTPFSLSPDLAVLVIIPFATAGIDRAFPAG